MKIIAITGGSGCGKTLFTNLLVEHLQKKTAVLPLDNYYKDRPDQIPNEKYDFDAVQPILACMGDTFIDCGGPGTGSRMKIVNNLMTTSLNVLTAQVLTFSEATGLDQSVALEVMGGTAAGRGHMSTTYPSKVLKGDLEPAFMIDLAKKDLDIAIKFSETLGVPISLAIQAEKIYTDAQADGRGRQDWTAIFDMLQKKQHSKS